jgi:prophage regulatory protein
MTSKILRLPSVLAITGLSRSSIYLKVAHGTFPKQVALGARAVGWRECDVQAWIEGLPER